MKASEAVVLMAARAREYEMAADLLSVTAAVTLAAFDVDETLPEDMAEAVKALVDQKV